MTATPWPIQHDIRVSMAFSAIVDLNGVMNPKTGGFNVVQDAIDAGHKSIWIRAGTYPGFTADVANLNIVGESWDVIIDGTTVGHAIEITGKRVTIRDLSVQTTPGQGNNYAGIWFSPGGEFSRAINCHSADSDVANFQFSCDDCLLLNCEAEAADGSGCVRVSMDRASIIGCRLAAADDSGYSFRADTNGDNFLYTGNHSDGIVIADSGSDNNLCVGNIGNAAFTDNGTGSTFANNEQY